MKIHHHIWSLKHSKVFNITQNGLSLLREASMAQNQEHSMRSSLLVQWVKDWALSLLWLWLLRWNRFNPWPGNFCMLQVCPPPQQNPVQYELNHVQEMKPQRRLEDNMARFYSWLLLGNGSSVIVFDSLYFSVFFIFYTGSLYHCNKRLESKV